MNEISENTKFNFSLQFMIVLVGGIVSLAFVYFSVEINSAKTTINENDIEKVRLESEKERKELRDEIMEFMNAELGGLRADMDKEDKRLLREIDKKWQ